MRRSQFFYWCFSVSFGALFVSLLASADQPATSEEVFISQQEASISWWVLYPEEERWQLLRFEARPHDLQDFIEKKSYSSKSMALERIEQETRGLFRPLLESSDAENSFLSNQALQNRTEEPGLTVWKTKRQWSQTWEEQFSEWIEKEVDKDFFVRHQISTDCADAIFAFRWIFARIHHLPVANQLAGSRMLFSNESFRSRWRRLKSDPAWHKDQRFLAALNYVMENTYTHSLFRDSYPIAINQETFLAGAYELEIRKQSGHAKLISQTHYHQPEENPFSLLFSDVPKEVRVLLSGDFWKIAPPRRAEGGFMRFRWPVQKPEAGDRWSLTEAELMPNYSLEQYSGPLAQHKPYYEGLTSRLQPEMKPVRRIQSGLQYITEQIENRIKAVDEGYLYCQSRNCQPGSQAYENWSTPSRDKRLQETMLEVRSYVIRYARHDPKLIDYWSRQLSGTHFEIVGRTLSLREIHRIFAQNLFRSEPWLTPQARWGLDNID